MFSSHRNKSLETKVLVRDTLLLFYPHISRTATIAELKELKFVALLSSTSTTYHSHFIWKTLLLGIYLLACILGKRQINLFYSISPTNLSVTAVIFTSQLIFVYSCFKNWLTFSTSSLHIVFLWATPNGPVGLDTRYYPSAWFWQ